MSKWPTPSPRIVLAVMVPFAILTLVGLGLTAVQGYELLYWERATATHVGDESGLLMRGDRVDRSITTRHYSFTKKDGREVQLYFYDTGSSPDRTLKILYSPRVEAQITASEPDNSRWDRAANLCLLLGVGLGLSAVGGIPCLLGVVLLFVAGFQR